MKRSFSLLLVVAIFGSAFDNQTIAGEKKLNVPPKGFKALFNGNDLSGWKGLVGNPKTRALMTSAELAEAQVKADADMREHWKPVEGIIGFDGKGKRLCTAK